MQAWSPCWCTQCWREVWAPAVDAAVFPRQSREPCVPPTSPKYGVRAGGLSRWCLPSPRACGLAPNRRKDPGSLGALGEPESAEPSRARAAPSRPTPRRSPATARGPPHAGTWLRPAALRGAAAQGSARPPALRLPEATPTARANTEAAAHGARQERQLGVAERGCRR